MKKKTKIAGIKIIIIYVILYINIGPSHVAFVKKLAFFICLVLLGRDQMNAEESKLTISRHVRQHY